MKRVYWRPRRISRSVLALIGCLSVLGLASVEFFQIRKKQPWYSLKIEAARRTKTAFEIIRQERLERTPSIDPEADPTGSGLMGRLMTPITTNVGHLPSKQSTVNPNFAAIVIQQLKRAGVEPGDLVAVGVSGSFPAVNIAVLAALEVMQAEALLISSVTGSQWGANDPDFTWLDMEALLLERRVISAKSLAASPGGIEDKALGLGKEDRQLIANAVERNGVMFLRPRNYLDSVERRWELYQAAAGNRPITAYVNVGGGTASVGTRVGKKLFKPGLNRLAPPGSTPFDSIMTRFVKSGVPVVHMVKMHRLAERYGLPLQFDVVPAVGEGKIYYREQYSTPLTSAVLVAILLGLWLFVRSDLGFRLLQSRRLRSRPGPPEQMV